MPWLSIQNHRCLEYLAAWDVHRAKLFGRCEEKNGIAPTERLIAQVMSQEPYRSAQRVFTTARLIAVKKPRNGSGPDGPSPPWARPMIWRGASASLIIKCRKMFRKQLIVTICIRERY
jgi:hypothetical protein